MTETSRQEEMKRYLFHELSPEESDTIEERFFEDTVYFNDLVELENDLVDGYVRGELAGQDLIRFEQSISKSSERREKIANARALQTLIAEENPKFETAAAPPGLLKRISSFFDLRMLNLKLAGGALAVIIVFTGSFLIYKNWQARQEFAEIQRKQEEAERIEKENRLRQLEEEQRRVEQERRLNQDNQNSENNSNNAPDATDIQSDEERKNKIEKLRRDIDDSPQKRNLPSSNLNRITPAQPYLAVSITKGNEDGDSSAELITNGQKQRIKITKSLPDDRNFSSYAIISKGKVIKNANIPEGAKSIEFTLEPEIQRFEINVTERNTRGGSETLGTYQVKLTRNK